MIAGPSPARCIDLAIAISGGCWTRPKVPSIIARRSRSGWPMAARSRPSYTGTWARSTGEFRSRVAIIERMRPPAPSTAAVEPRRRTMPLEPATLIKDDQDHWIHPLHHPSDHLEPLLLVRGREELAQAAAHQIGELAYFSGYTGSSNIPAVELAEKLISISYKNMQGVFFTCGGAESNESAFKTARFYWKAKGKPDKVKIIARTLAYHGVTLQAMSATGMSPYWKMFEPRVPNFVHIPTCYPYRQEGTQPGETAGQTAARLLEEAIIREGADTVAAFIAEPIHGGGGVLYPTDDYFPLVRQVCDRHNVLFIADEVITGFCRTGKWFALEHWRVLPDIVSFAKGVSSGYLPLGGIMVSKAIKQAMDEVKP